MKSSGKRTMASCSSAWCWCRPDGESDSISHGDRRRAVSVAECLRFLFKLAGERVVLFGRARAGVFPLDAFESAHHVVMPLRGEDLVGQRKEHLVLLADVVAQQRHVAAGVRDDLVACSGVAAFE